MSIEKVIEDGIEYDVETNEKGDTNWYHDGKLHRVDNPAREWANGRKCWILLNRLIYCDELGSDKDCKMTVKMKMSIIKYRLTRKWTRD